MDFMAFHMGAPGGFRKLRHSAHTITIMSPVPSPLFQRFALARSTITIHSGITRPSWM
jgi:hypothetical protein